jgi:hypothetical protein
VHFSPLFPVNPELHEQLLDSLLPAGELEKSGHAVQTEESAVENVEEGHRVHLSKLSPAYPALQKQRIACVIEFELGGQELHASLFVLPLYFPDGQATHFVPEYSFPAVHTQLADPAGV